MLKSNEIQRNQARCTSLSAYGAETLLEAFCFRLHLTTWFGRCILFFSNDDKTKRDDKHGYPPHQARAEAPQHL